MIKDDIEKIISDKEPVYALSGYLHRLPIEKKREFWISIKNFILNGHENQKTICLAFISLEENDLIEDLIDHLIISINPKNASKNLASVIGIIQVLKRKDLVPYCEDALKAALKRNDRMVIEISFRTLIIIDWHKAIDHLLHRLEEGNENQIVDTLAFFKHIHSEEVWLEFLNMLNESNQNKIKNITKKITLRCKKHYNLMRDRAAR